MLGAISGTEPIVHLLQPFVAHNIKTQMLAERTILTEPLSRDNNFTGFKCRENTQRLLALLAVWLSIVCCIFVQTPSDVQHVLYRPHSTLGSFPIQVLDEHIPWP